MNQSATLARVVSVLLVLSAILFWVGSSLERVGEGGAERSSVSQAAAPSVSPSPRTAAVEGSEEAERAERAGQPTTTQSEVAHAGENSPGINLEAPAFRAAAVGISVLLAIVLWAMPSASWLLIVVAVFAAVFGLLDLRELLFQAARGRTLIVVLSGGLVVLHAAAAAVAGKLLLKARRTAPPAISAISTS